MPKAQGKSVALPHNSPLMKFPRRPVNNPMPGKGARKSNTSAMCLRFTFANTQAATMTPASPP